MYLYIFIYTFQFSVDWHGKPLGKSLPILDTLNPQFKEMYVYLYRDRTDKISALSFLHKDNLVITNLTPDEMCIPLSCHFTFLIYFNFPSDFS
jgi:hypothetical protein